MVQNTYKVCLLSLKIFVLGYLTGMTWYIIVNEARRISNDPEVQEVNFLTSFELLVMDESTGTYVDGRP